MAMVDMDMDMGMSLTMGLMAIPSFSGEDGEDTIDHIGTSRNECWRIFHFSLIFSYSRSVAASSIQSRNEKSMDLFAYVFMAPGL